jgi:hypothetical protein
MVIQAKKEAHNKVMDKERSMLMAKVRSLCANAKEKVA